VSDVLFLDSGPLGLITQPQRSNEVIAITDWLKDCLRAGARVVVPGIVYYEIKRELLRANKSVGIARLDAFVNATPDRYLPLPTTPFALERNCGLDPEELADQLRTPWLSISMFYWPRRLSV
jgi:hypothetical protein